VPNIELAQSINVELDENHYAVTDFYQTTNEKGVFVAGDICGDLKHIVAASGQGAKAAYNINKYLKIIHAE
jgi:thioredoxin reductase (NADPH)